MKTSIEIAEGTGLLPVFWIVLSWRIQLSLKGQHAEKGDAEVQV